jgi:miniconductance mechanosensitive channel
MILSFLEDHPWIETAVVAAFVVILALAANVIVKTVVLNAFNRAMRYISFGRDEEIRRHGLIRRLVNIVPAIVLMIGVKLVPGLPSSIVTIVGNVASAFIVLTIVLALSAALSIAETIWNRRPDAKEKPIKGYVQVIKIGLFIVGGILAVGALVDRSPLILLSGLGAMAAVLLLVFQDTLLSLVASIQISSSNMVRLGDWIEMPQLNADGDVVEIALHTVKVQNWDKTITTIPTRKLISDSFKNWRGMTEAGGRRIKRAINLDQTSIRFLRDDEIVRLSEIRVLRSYMNGKLTEIDAWNKANADGSANPVNLRHVTNIGTFRAYVQHHLQNHPGIHKGMTLLVRQLAPGPEGLPLEIYCFTASTAWVDYETIQSDLFDHLYAVLPEFGLRPFQNPTGADVAHLFGAGAAQTQTAEEGKRRQTALA